MPLVAALASKTTAAEAERAQAGFKVAANADRTGEELLIMGGKFDVKVSARDTGGDLCIYDTVRNSKGGPALHQHFHQEEWFYVIRGQFVVEVGGQRMTLGPGDSALAPRRVPHAFAMTSEGQGQLLIAFQPAGPIEEFFRKMAAMGSTIPKDANASMRKLWADYGMEYLGPPLKY